VTFLSGHSRRTAANVRATAALPGVSRSATAVRSAVGGARASRARGAAGPIGGASPRAIPVGPVRPSTSRGASAGPCAVSCATSRAIRARPIVSRRAADTRTVSGAGARATPAQLSVRVHSGRLIEGPAQARQETVPACLEYHIVKNGNSLRR